MIKVIIQRKVIPDFLDQYNQSIRKVHRQVMSATGFVSSEVLQSAHNSNHHYSIVTFDNEHNWQQWYRSDKRQQTLGQILPMLEEPEKVSILKYISRA